MKMKALSRLFIIIFKDFIHPFVRDRERERERERDRDIGRRRSRFPTGSLMWNLTQGLWDHTKGKADTQPLPSHQGAPLLFFLDYLFIHERHTERGRGPTGSLMLESIPITP